VRATADDGPPLASQQRFIDLSRERTREPADVDRGAQQLAPRRRPSEFDKLRPKKKRKRKDKHKI
jgi:hypothetical protein